MKITVIRSLICIKLLVLTAFGQSTNGEWVFTTQSNTASITRYIGTNQVITIPEVINGYVVTSVNNIQSMGFLAVPVKQVNIPNTIQVIGDEAFCNTAITNITIPASVSSIGKRVFSRCHDLKTINVDEGNTNYSATNGVLFNKNQTKLISFPPAHLESFYSIPTGTTEICEYAFEMSGVCQINLPLSIQSIRRCAFLLCGNLQTINLPGTIDLIEEYAFSSSGVTSITIPPSLKIIPNGMFSSCHYLNQITLPNTISEIGAGAFSGCSSLQNINIPSSVTNVGAYAFSGSQNLETVNFKTGLNSIGNGAFYMCKSLTNILIPATVTSIGTSSFSHTGITSFEIPPSLVKINTSLFYNCTNLTNVNIPLSVVEIGDEAFFGCSRLKKIDLPKNLSKIGSWSFIYCSLLEKVTIPPKIKSIGYSAFTGCDNLSDVYFLMDGPNFDLYYLENIGISSTSNIFIPPNSTNWVNYEFGSRKTEKIVPIIENPTFEIVGTTNNLTIYLLTIQGIEYAVETSTNLTSWINILNISGDGIKKEITSKTSGNQSFLRVRQSW